jgi:hypothetical protein
MRLNLHFPRFFGEPSHFVSLVLWGVLAKQLHGCLSGDVARHGDSGNDFILYQWPFEFPWTLTTPKPDEKKFRPNLRANLQYGENFRNYFVKGTLPEILRYNRNKMLLEFDNIVGRVVIDPEQWEHSALDGRELQSDITENQSPDRGCLLVKRRRTG